VTGRLMCMHDRRTAISPHDPKTRALGSTAVVGAERKLIRVAAAVDVACGVWEGRTQHTKRTHDISNECTVERARMRHERGTKTGAYQRDAPPRHSPKWGVQARRPSRGHRGAIPLAGTQRHSRKVTRGAPKGGSRNSHTADRRFTASLRRGPPTVTWTGEALRLI